MYDQKLLGTAWNARSRDLRRSSRPVKTFEGLERLRQWVLGMRQGGTHEVVEVLIRGICESRSISRRLMISE